MPRIPDDLQRSIVFIYPDAAAAAAGSGAGGTGFLVRVQGVTRPEPFVYLVTNMHVARSASRSIRIAIGQGRTETIEVGAEEWVNHPEGDDVAVAEISTESTWEITGMSWHEVAVTPKQGLPLWYRFGKSRTC